MAQGYRPISKEVHARALVDLLRGDPVAVVAERYDVSERTVYNWLLAHQREHPPLQDDFTTQRARSRARTMEEIEDLILEQVYELGQAVLAQARQLQERGWLESHTVTDVARSLDTTQTQQIRLLQGFERVHGPPALGAGDGDVDGEDGDPGEAGPAS